MAQYIASAKQTTHLVFGTGGHVNHGKSSLVMALTGMDPDRLKEEKRRGMTIELGFTHGLSSNGQPLAFVDVPGHEGFIHTMLAGVAGIDAVLMVVAADEGVMPQTIEHLNICELLGISKGIVVLSRADLVSDNALKDRENEVKKAFAGTFLENAPLQAISIKSGNGLDKLRDLLTNNFQHNRILDAQQPFRMVIDRSFHMKGFGTVITGTVLSGDFTLKETAWLYPHHQAVRVRKMEVHGKEVDVVRTGQRAAINVVGFSHQDIHRGNQLAARGCLLTGSLINAQAKLSKTAPQTLSQRSRLRMHLYANEVMARVIPLETASWKPGQTQYIQLRLEKSLSTKFLDRFVLRSYSPLCTIGGGVVIEPDALKSHGDSAIRGVPIAECLQRLHQASIAEKITAAALIRPHGLLLQSQINPRTAILPKDLPKLRVKLASQSMLTFDLPKDTGWLHTQAQKQNGEYLKKILFCFHRQHPEKNGMKAVEIAGKMPPSFGTSGTQVLLEYMVTQGEITQYQDHFQLLQHQVAISPQKKQDLERLIDTIRSAIQPPRLNSLLKITNLSSSYTANLLATATKTKQLIRIKPDLYYLPQTIQRLTFTLCNYLDKNQSITVIEFKSLANISRKHAVDLLEYFDSQHLTIRLENHRMLRPFPK